MTRARRARPAPVRTHVLRVGECVVRRAHPGIRKRLEIESRHLAAQHERLAEFFCYVSDAVESAEFALARAVACQFRNALEDHCSSEERLIFPVLRSLGGAVTREVLRLGEEHSLIRALMYLLEAALGGAEVSDVPSLLDDLAEAMTAHHVREESLMERIVA